MTILCLALTCLWVIWLAFALLKHLTTALVASLIAAGFFQSFLVAVTMQPIMQYWDDAALTALLLSALIRRSTWTRDRVAIGALAIWAAAVTVALLRASQVDVGVDGARQAATPAVLIFCGWILQDRIRWRPVALLAVGLGSITAIYMIIESALQRPIIDPATSIALLNPGSEVGFREGLPSAYFADGLGSHPWFRAGGLFFNPPIAGVFLAVCCFAALYLLGRSRATVAFSIACIGVTAASVTRAGVLMILAVLLGPLVWRFAGAKVTALLGAAALPPIFFVLSKQGNTGSHSDGLLLGMSDSVVHPWGYGFGSAGYFSGRSGGDPEVGESLLGVLGTSLGFIVPVALIALIVFVTRAGRHWPVRPDAHFYLLAVVGVAAISESSSALQGTSLMWLLVGAVMRDIDPTRVGGIRAGRSDLPVDQPVERSDRS